jgi:hypothetical protein
MDEIPTRYVVALKNGIMFGITVFTDRLLNVFYDIDDDDEGLIFLDRCFIRYSDITAIVPESKIETEK